MEESTIWSFPDRGSWATHSGRYRGNWSPYVPRNLILRYSKENDWILDQFLGSGTTLIEAKLLNRNAIGVDINPKSISLSKHNLEFQGPFNPRIHIRQGTARDLAFIKDNSIDLVCTHPPYADIIKYSDNIDGDISHLEYDSFLDAMQDVATESIRVLKTGGICAFMIGDIRKSGYVLPLGMDTMRQFTNSGFVLKEIVIKEQHRCRSEVYWENRQRSFYLLAHEYVFVLEKRRKLHDR
ncbi:MAG: methyltransferase domain-containing protein [Lachnospiraceae bacterium]|nr:methyltransferase domain-containing protein [Lachnospiraceae bacterium]